MIVYLHGFNSAGSYENEKVKALQTIDEVLPITYDTFASRNDIMDDLIKQTPLSFDDDIVFCGTSLGGYFAALLAKHFGTPSILINPLCDPLEYFDSQLNTTFENYVTKEIKSLVPENHDQYTLLENDPSKYSYIPLVLVAEDDTVVSASKTRNHLSEFLVHSFTKGGHRFDDFSKRLGLIKSYICRSSIATDLNS
jgi:predicted esterase YcpF (UPF0227 family)